MVGITLKNFQIDCVNNLLDATSVGLKKEILVQAPTGSGKTIILINYIEEYLMDDEQTIFIWLTPGKGDLEEQSRKKMMKYTPKLNTKDISEVLLHGFEAKDIAFINWETITKKGNNAIKEAERKNLFDRIDEAHNLGFKFIIIIDEEHLNKTIKADAIIQYIKADYIIRVSATTKKNKEAEYIEINELDVINEGLITKALYINEGVENNVILKDEHSYLLDLAINKQKTIRKEYISKDISINPLIIIQIPNNSADFLKKIENILEEKGYSYKNKTLAKWLADPKGKENIENIEDNEAEPIILIMKQAISTGWDCPRAKVLVKLRDNMNEDFETQTIGRIRRMPQGKHYDNILLDNCYLYTFDNKYSETVKQELGKNAYDVKLVFLRKEFKDFSLIKEYKNNQNDGFGDREAFQVIYKYFIEKYKLSANKKQNQTVLENNGYIFGNVLNNKILQDKIVQLDSEELGKANRIKVSSIVNTHKNGIDLRHSIGIISTKIGMRYDKTRAILERLFLKRTLFDKKFLNLSLIDFYTFIINNTELLKYDFLEAVSQKSVQLQFKFNEIREEKFKFPEMGIVRYDPEMRDTTIMKKNVYSSYPSSSQKSNSEKMFEFYIENNNSIKWYYKNGELSQEYFSIIYKDAVNKNWSFYPDYIICDKNNNIWIIETKGGEDSSGRSKNIDIKVENKFEALKRYCNLYGLKWAFLREYDKNNRLYLCNTKYTERMESENWILIDKIF